MPAFEFEKYELDRLVAYVRTLSASSGRAVSAGPVAGDAAKGRQVYERGGCAGCHRVGSEGSVFGPEKYARLVALKDEWDPDNLFRRNQNIKPSAA